LILRSWIGGTWTYDTRSPSLLWVIYISAWWYWVYFINENQDWFRNWFSYYLNSSQDYWYIEINDYQSDNNHFNTSYNHPSFIYGNKEAFGIYLPIHLITDLRNHSTRRSPIWSLESNYYHSSSRYWWYRISDNWGIDWKDWDRINGFRSSDWNDNDRFWDEEW
jgi:hypothetical protein